MKRLLIVGAVCVCVFILPSNEKSVVSAKSDRETHNIQVVQKTPRTPRYVRLPLDESGMVRAYVRVNDADVPMLVDTGAAYVAITEKFAASLTSVEYVGMATIGPAWGPSRKLTKVNLREVQIGAIVMKNVTAIILPEATDNLLGMSFLSRLARWEYGNRTLVLEQ